MVKIFTAIFLCCCLGLTAQQKKTGKQPAKPVEKAVVPANQPVPWESVDQVDTTAAAEQKKKEEDPTLPREFLVYTKKPKQKEERMKLCFHLISKDTVLDHCINDSICRDPEVYKQLYESRQGDTTYILIYVEAFTKGTNDIKCDAGRESKLVYFRWNTKTNKTKFKQKVVASCTRGIVNMTKDPIVNWDQNVPLEVSYYKGGNDFPVIRFDPGQYLLGLQEFSEAEPK